MDKVTFANNLKEPFNYIALFAIGELDAQDYAAILRIEGADMDDEMDYIQEILPVFEACYEAANKIIENK